MDFLLNDRLPDCPMPSAKPNSKTANATSLVFSLFDIASAQDVPFGILQWTNQFLLCVPFIFADSKKCDLVVACDGFLYNHSGYFDYGDAFRLNVDSYWCICNELKIVEKEVLEDN